MDSLLGGNAGFSSLGGATGAGGNGPENEEEALFVFQSLSLGLAKDSEAAVGSSGKGLDQVSSAAEFTWLLASSAVSFSISLGKGARKLGRTALLVFLYLSIKVAGAHPSFSSIWMYHQPLPFFSTTCK